MTEKPVSMEDALVRILAELAAIRDAVAPKSLADIVNEVAAESTRRSSQCTAPVNQLETDSVILSRAADKARKDAGSGGLLASLMLALADALDQIAAGWANDPSGHLGYGEFRGRLGSDAILNVAKEYLVLKFPSGNEVTR